MDNTGKNTEYWKKFYKKWVRLKRYVDIETGEIITAEQYKNYKTIKKEYEKKYGRNNYAYEITTYIGRNHGKQLGIW